MSEIPGWQFAVETHPAGWRFPAGKTWVAGWIQPAAGGTVTDIRARLDQRVILGLSGLPHPAFAETPGEHARPDPSGPGFSFLLLPHTGSTLLRLEVRDQTDRWTEFFRTVITAPGETALVPAAGLSTVLRGLVTVLLRQRRRNPRRSWFDAGDDLMAGFVAEPLNVEPSLPFVGALEEPLAIGRRRNGCIPVTGWLAHGTAQVTRLLVIIDALPVVVLPHGLAREEIGGTFPALLDRNDLAFVGQIALPVDYPAPVLLKVFAELDNGERHLVFTRRFTPRSYGDTGQMPALVPGRTFARAVWTLHQAAGRYVVPRGGLLREARTLWADYQAIPACSATITHQPVPVARPPATPGAPANLTIAPADDMLGSDVAEYFQVGREALALVQAACVLGGTRVESILDLPSGHGRVARWLRTAYPMARLAVSDTQVAGVEFCIAQFDATGVPAHVDGRHWPSLAGPYDVIWCGSLLTHFGRDQWLEHLRLFTARLTPTGVLVFSTHGQLALEKLETGEKDYGLTAADITSLCDRTLAEGFGYANYPDTPGYGISISQPTWIRTLVGRETDLQVLAIHESAWNRHQDVVVCSRRTIHPAEG